MTGHHTTGNGRMQRRMRANGRTTNEAASGLPPPPGPAVHPPIKLTGLLRSYLSTTLFPCAWKPGASSL